LDLKISDEDILSFESGLFETDRFLCGDLWHRDGQMRKAIRLQFEEKRANKELDILVQEVNRYVNWHRSSITRAETPITKFGGWYGSDDELSYFESFDSGRKTVCRGSKGVGISKLEYCVHKVRRALPL
jgi:hypothetical protein